MEKGAAGCPSLPSHYGLTNPGTSRTSPAAYPTSRPVWRGAEGEGVARLPHRRPTRPPHCVDELHLGHFTLLLATDPLADLPVAFALVASHDQDHMRRFLQDLKNGGLNPQVVVTDGSNLDPAVLAELWSDADHQLCVFHVIKDLTKLVLNAVRRLRTAMGRRGQAGRKKKRGRDGAKSKAAAATAGA